jgi:hypothetical protein
MVYSFLQKTFSRIIERFLVFLEEFRKLIGERIVRSVQPLGDGRLFMTGNL